MVEKIKEYIIFGIKVVEIIEKIVLLSVIEIKVFSVDVKKNTFVSVRINDFDFDKYFIVFNLLFCSFVLSIN